MASGGKAGPPPRRLELRFVDSTSSTASCSTVGGAAATPAAAAVAGVGEDSAGTRPREELVRIEISNHDAHSSAHTLRAAVVVALLEEFGSAIDPATVELQQRSAGKGWSRWRPPSDFAQLSEKGSEVRLYVHEEGSAQALRARSQWQAAQRAEPEAGSDTEDGQTVATDEIEVAFGQVCVFLGTLGSARFASPSAVEENAGDEPPAVVLARRCCRALDEFGTRPSEWLETLTSMPLETLVDFVGACEVQQPGASSSQATTAHGYQTRSAARATPSASVSSAAGGWSIGGAATITSSLVPCELVLCSSRGALIMYAEQEHLLTPAVPEKGVLDDWAGWLHGWRALGSSPCAVVRDKLAGGGDLACTTSDSTPTAESEAGRPRYRHRTAAEIGRIHFGEILHCCVLEAKKPVPPPLQCTMPPEGYPHQQRCANSPCKCACRWACLQAGRCRTAAQRGEVGIIEHFPCCEMGRCHVLCPVAAATRGQAIVAEPLHTLHLVLLSEPSATSAAEAVAGECSTSTELTLLVSGERGLLLAAQLQERVSTQQVGGA